MQPLGLTLPSPTIPKREVGLPLSLRVEVRREADTTVMEAWAALEDAAPCSIYQTRAWLLPWTETMGRKAGLVPLFILAFAPDDRPLALFCLGVRRRGPLTVAMFLGGKDSNFAMPLVRRGTLWTQADVRRLIKRAVKGLGGDAPDAFAFTNQPQAWDGVPNPLLALPHQPSPSDAFGTALPARAEDFFAVKLSKESRKKLRRKEARLAEIGPLTHLVADTPAHSAVVLDRFLEQRVERFRAQNIVSEFNDPRMRAFIERANAGTQHGIGIELHALKVADRIVAVYGGGAHGPSWSGMFNSFDSDPAIARNSPGDLLLMKIIAAQCAAGRTHVDLGVGEARYKTTFCDEPMPLFDSFMATSARGSAFVAARRITLRVKRMIKRNPRFPAAVRRLRRFMPSPSRRSPPIDQAT